MNSNVKLNFRHAPLKLPVKKKQFMIPDIEQALPSPKVKSDKKENVDIMQQRVNIRWYYFTPCILLLYFFIPEKPALRTLVKLKCSLHNRQMKCSGEPKGTFIVEVLDKCSQSIYEVDSVPFHIAHDKDMYRVPAKSLTVSNIDGDCMPKAYLDSVTITKDVPFCWVTTSQHTWFSIEVDGQRVVDKADVLFFDRVKHGNWIAYMFDMDVRGKHVVVKGDGHDIIYVYGV